MKENIKMVLLVYGSIGISLVGGYLIGKRTKNEEKYEAYMDGVNDCLLDLKIRAEAKQKAEKEIQEIKEDLGLS